MMPFNVVPLSCLGKIKWHCGKLLEKGILWRVGDGKTIRMTKDCWLPNCHMLLKPNLSLSDELIVSYLIDEEKGGWNETVVRECFKQAEAEKILNIPLCYTSCNDFSAWKYTKSGVYTVKSGYYLKRLEAFHNSQSISGKGENSDQRATSKMWNLLWSVRVPPKMKIILWRMAHDCLPTGVQLKGRHIYNSDICFFCGRKETLEHAMFMCQHASAVWHTLKDVLALKLYFNTTFQLNIGSLISLMQHLKKKPLYSQ
jgi:hypothetical protein